MMGDKDARTCPTCGAYMASGKVADFTVGQRVMHTSNGEGTVMKIDEMGMTVAFDGSRNVGVFDDRWFRICGPNGTTIVPAPTDTPHEAHP